MHEFPKPSANFNEKKQQILDQLAKPDADYTDLSPKGSVDKGIKDLIGEVNKIDGFVTTSSCAGRVSVFIEGRKTADPAHEGGQLATPGGKGGGGTWAFISHDPVPNDGIWVDALQLSYDRPDDSAANDPADRRLIHFKFEPMILHVFTASPQHAQAILGCALQAGFRESGAINIVPPRQSDEATPMVGIRSMGLGFESLIGQLNGDQRELMVPRSHLNTLMAIANDRFVENTRRIGRFRQALLNTQRPRANPDGQEWEGAAARRERKKAEGLKKKAELESERRKEGGNPERELDDPITWHTDSM